MRTIHTIARACVCRFLTTTQKINLEIRVSQNLAKLGGRPLKMSGMEGEEYWSKLGSLGGRVSTLALKLEGEM